MKKKLLIASLVLLCVAGIAATIALYQLDRHYGWMVAEPVYHDVLAADETRLRVSIDTLRLSRELEPYLPEENALPAWLPWSLPEILPRVVPREVAVLGGSNFREGQYDFILFVNEQRGGPALPELINTRTRFRQSFPLITWDDPGFKLNRRGVLTAEGHLDLPFAVEEEVLKLWTPELPADRLSLHGGHTAEAVVDNRNGEILVLIAACAPIWNTSLEALQQNPQFAAVMAIVGSVLDVRIAADFKDVDTLLIQFRVNAEEEIGGQLEFFVPLMLPAIEQQIQRQYGLVMKSEYAWDPAEHTYIVDVTLKGIEEKLKDYFRRTIPAPPAG